MLYAPLFIRKNFSKPEKFSKTVSFLLKIFRRCERNHFQGKIVTPLLCINFYDSRNFLKHWRIARGNFRQSERENFLRKNVKPLLRMNFFDNENFLNIEVMPTKIFGTLRQRIFDGKTWYPLLCIKIFDYPKLSETLKGCPRFFLGTVRPKIFRRKSLIPRFSSIKTFRNQKVSKNSRIPVQKFLALWDIQLWAEICDTRIMHKFFQYPKFSETLKGFPRNFSALWDKNFLTENCDTLLCINNFHTRIFLKHWRNAHEKFRHCETEKVWRKNVIPPIMHKTFGLH